MGIRRLVMLTACALALQFGSSCTAAAGSEPKAAIPKLKVHGGPAVWRVKDKDTTIYLFGTIHFLPDNTPWLDADLREALQSSGELVTELDPAEGDKLAGLLEQNGYLPAGENLRDKLAPQDRIAFESLLVSLGIAVDRFDRYKPWSAGLYLSALMIRLSGFDPEKGVEQVVEDNAAPGSTRSALETIQFQVELFNGMPEDKQITYLNQIVASEPTLEHDLAAMLSQWLGGDADSLATLMNDEATDPAIYRHILTDRNANWAKWIKARLAKPGTVFVAVGAGHLAGAGSVQDQLKKLGLKSKRVH